MRTVCYHLATTLTLFAAGMGQTLVVRDGRLIGIHIKWSVISGAGTFIGNCSAMLNQNSVNDTLTNNPPRETFLGSHLLITAAATATQGAGSPYIPLNIPVRAGDIFTINAGNGGAAAPTNSALIVDFYVTEA